MVAVVKSKKDNKPLTKKKTQDLLIKGGIKKKKQSNAVRDMVKSLENKGPEILKAESMNLCKTFSSSPYRKKVVKRTAPVTENMSSQSPAAEEMITFQEKTGKRANVSSKCNKNGKIREMTKNKRNKIKKRKRKIERNKIRALETTDLDKELEHSPKTRVSFSTKRNMANEKEKKSVSKKKKLQEQTSAIRSSKIKRKLAKEENVHQKRRQIHLQRRENIRMKKITRKIIEEYVKVPESSIGRLIQIALELENGNESMDSDIVMSGLKNLILKVVEEYHIVSQSGTKPKLKKLIQNVIEFNSKTKDTKEKKDENNVCCKQVRKVIEALSAILKRQSHWSKRLKTKKEDLLFNEPQSIFVQIACMKIPRTPSREIRVLLPHSPMSELGEVCIIVRDLEKDSTANHEPTIQYFKEIFTEQNVNNIAQIVPFCQLKTEYGQYEMMRALCNRFDAFLVDSSVCGHVSKVLGSIFIARRKVPTPVNLSREKLFDTINKALRKTSFRVSRFSNTLSAKIGHSKMTLKELYDNLLAFCYKLPKVFPGGWQNIASLRIKGTRTSSLPFYVSEVQRDSVRVPIVKPIRPKAFEEVKGELDYYGRVFVRPDGKTKASYQRFDDKKKSKRNTRKMKKKMNESNKKQNLALEKVENVNFDVNVKNAEAEEVSAFKHRLLQCSGSEELREKNPEDTNFKKDKSRSLTTLEKSYLWEHALEEKAEAEEKLKKLNEMKFLLRRQGRNKEIKTRKLQKLIKKKLSEHIQKKQQE